MNALGIMTGTAIGLMAGVLALTSQSGRNGAGPRGAVPHLVILAPDRGFLGNEEVRDLVTRIGSVPGFSVVFLGNSHPAVDLDTAVAQLPPTVPVVLLPLFPSMSDARLSAATAEVSRMEASRSRQVAIGDPFGTSAYGIEVLRRRLSEIPNPNETAVGVVVPAVLGEGPERVDPELTRLAARAARGYGFQRVEVIMWPEDWSLKAADRGPRMRERVRNLAAAGEPVLVPFGFGKRLDHMMTWERELRRAAPEAEIRPAGEFPAELVDGWVRREAVHHRGVTPDEICTLVVAHGASVHWNNEIREAVEPLQENRCIETTFGMADRDLVQRALGRLERRGARGVVLVRVFGLESSFRAGYEEMLGIVSDDGMDGIDSATGAVVPAGLLEGRPRRPLIPTGMQVVTVGGVEDHPLLVQSIIDRFRQVSLDPSKEVILLTAHGSGSDVVNSHWEQVLENIGASISRSVPELHDIRGVTWREDWPEKRKDRIAGAREWVSRFTRRGFRVIVAPVRTAGEGPAHDFLEGLEFTQIHGFAPHPLFTRWLEEQIELGMRQLQAGAGRE